MSILANWFRIFPGEGRKVLQFALLGALLQAGLAMGITIGDTLFLSRVGVDKLPVIYLATPLMMLVYIPVYTWLTGKFGVQRVMDITLSILLIGGIGFGVLFRVGGEGVELGQWAYYAAKFYSTLWFIALYTLFWNFVDLYFDILDAKRVYAILSGGCALGAVVGGGLVAGLVEIMTVGELYFGWALLVLAVWPVLAMLRKENRTLDDWGEMSGDANAGLLQQTQVAMRAMLRSRFVLILALLLFCTLVVTTLCEFQYMGVFSSRYEENELAGLLGKLTAGVNLFNLFITFFLFNRMIGWWGVRNIVLLQPLVYMATFLWMGFDNGMAPAIFGFFAYQGMLTSVENNNINLLFQAMPAKAKSQIRTVLEGMCEPTATAVTGGFLMLAISPSYQMTFEELAIIGLTGAALCLVLALLLRPQYAKSLVENLKLGWINFSGRGGEIGLLLAEEDVYKVKDRMGAEGRHDRGERIAAIQIILENKKQGGVEALLEFLGEKEDAWTGKACVLLDQVLQEVDDETLRKVMLWLDGMGLDLSHEVLEVLSAHHLIPLGMLSLMSRDVDPEVRAVSAISLWNSWDLDNGIEPMVQIQRMLAGDVNQKRMAIRSLGLSKQERYAHFLVKFLQDENSEIRKETLEAILRLVDMQSGRLVSFILPLLRQEDPEERMLALEGLRRIRDASNIRELLLESTHFTPAEKRVGEQILIGLGLQAIPRIVAALRDASMPYAGRSIAARALGYLSFAQLEAVLPDLLDEEITRAYQYLALHVEVKKYAKEGRATEQRTEDVGWLVLGRFYREQQRQIVGFVLELLALGGRLPDYEMLGAALQSPGEKERANAVETIEQSCSRSLFLRFGPLVDGRPQEQLMQKFTSWGGRTNYSEQEILQQALKSPFLLERLAAVHVFVETDQEGKEHSIREMLYADGSPAMRQALISMLSKISGKARDADMVDQIGWLIRHSRLSGMGVYGVMRVAERSCVVRLKVGEEIALGENEFGMVWHGTAEVLLKNEWTRIQTGEVIGKEIFEQKSRKCVKVRGVEGSEGADQEVELILFDWDVVMAAGRSEPDSLIALLAGRREVANA